MPNPVRVGIINCDRYRTCAAGSACGRHHDVRRPHIDYFKTFITHRGSRDPARI